MTMLHDAGYKNPLELKSQKELCLCTVWKDISDILYGISPI